MILVNIGNKMEIVINNNSTKIRQNALAKIRTFKTIENLYILHVPFTCLDGILIESNIIFGFVTFLDARNSCKYVFDPFCLI